jgi:kynureninase
VEGHFRGDLPWMDYHEFVRDDLATVVGAQPSEVVAMNTLGVNLHLMMVSFYRPTPERHAILIEAGSFPTDRYAVESQVRFHGYDPATALIELKGDEANGAISMEAIERVLAEHGSRIALVMLPGVQYRTGQAFDLAAITRLASRHGCMVGFDLAHAVGNLPLQLHDIGADFAIWCSYKYLNSGPGAVGGAFGMSDTRAPPCRVLRDGGATTRPAASRWARNSCPPTVPTAGSSAIRRFWRSHRCACRWRSSVAPACRSCARNRCASPAIWNGWCSRN